MLDKANFLIALAQEQHFGRAAEACGVTQPTLSAAARTVVVARRLAPILNDLDERWIM
jgi:Bacterial regulatory helix-turn-helix protein, lysR family